MNVPNGEKIVNLRNLVATEIGKYSPNYSDDSLHRWLLNYKEDLSEIVPKLKCHLKNRQLLGLDDPNLIETMMNPIDILARNNRHFLPSINHLNCVDRDGNAVSFCHLGFGSAAVFKHLSVREIINHHLLGAETGIRLVDLHKSEGKVPFLTTVLDLDGIGGHIHTYLRESRNVVPEISRNYPAINGRLIFVNCPMLIDIVGKFLCSFFSHYCEIIFFGHKQILNNLLKYLSIENIPEHYGGQLNSPMIDYATCMNIEVEPIERPEKPLLTTQVWLKPKLLMSIPIEVGTDATKIFWWFQTDGDVEFGLYFGKDLDLDNMLIPQFCLSTQHFPESGTVDTVGSGIYTAIFICPNSRIFETKLSYSIQLLSE